MSRDIPEKFHPDDVSIFSDLAGDGCTVRLQGATCLQAQFAGTGVQVFPAGQVAAPQFLQELDIFYYRTGGLVETFGRVVFEAMACGLPVVCHSHGGYADWIKHGDNGFLFDTSDEARDILARLVADATSAPAYWLQRAQDSGGYVFADRRSKAAGILSKMTQRRRPG